MKKGRVKQRPFVLGEQSARRVGVKVNTKKKKKKKGFWDKIPKLLQCHYSAKSSEAGVSVGLGFRSEKELHFVIERLFSHLICVKSTRGG